MKEAIELRDEDGFIRLLPRRDYKEQYAYSPSVYPKIVATIGDYALLKADDDIATTHNKCALSVSDNIPYQVIHKAKSWQAKAWNLIGGGIDWTRPSSFRKIGPSKKMRHVVRIGLAMKVRATAGRDSRPIFDNLVPNNPNSKTYPTSGMYAIIDDQRTFEHWVFKMRGMFLDDAKVKNYLARARKADFHGVDFIMKAFIVYDDKSYDALVGNPYQLEHTLELTISKDNKTINWRK